MWKNFFYFSSREKNGILLLSVAVAGVFAGKFIFSKNQDLPKPIEALKSDSNTNHYLSDNPDSQEKAYYYPDRPKPFHRNSNSKNFQDEKRTYYQDRNPESSKSKSDSSFRKFPKTEKFASGTVIEINRTDTSELMKIPGVGASFASRIIKYRQILGGFYSVKQLQEVYGMYVEMYEKISPFFQVSKDSIHLIPVNKSSLERLKSHPYINFYQAKAIVELRKKKGALKNTDELRLLEEFTAEDLERIKPYFSFE